MLGSTLCTLTFHKYAQDKIHLINAEHTIHKYGSDCAAETEFKPNTGPVLTPVLLLEQLHMTVVEKVTSAEMELKPDTGPLLTFLLFRVDCSLGTKSCQTRNGAAEADAYPHAAGLVMGPCIVEIDRIVIRDVQYKFEVIQRTNEEVFMNT
ncbi:hypothetical protein DPMN_033500 [Dreissena polymorpha]|uniref:Uncharacterized protein n=1 Tax=Dreissena polymorpha TaxID=45954 RepID=A0A9D4M5Y5_DREPO|nr:hypothetical protein DPMN_033500 [Dreissena polymorpha]